MVSSVYNIYPTLIQCFTIILIGYITGRFNIITPSQGKGISLFILNISLPSLIFKAIVEVNFASIDWRLWCGILISKTILFVVVGLVTLCFQKNDRFGKAGLYGIFVTQSNDFAFGLPLCEYLRIVIFVFLLHIIILLNTAFEYLNFSMLCLNKQVKHSAG